MTEEELERKLLVKAALEAVLTKSTDRFDAAARDQRLKAATLLACAEKGYADLTVAEIAQRAKVSTASIYGAYKDREALLVAAIEMLLSILADDRIEAPQIADPMQRVHLLLIAHGLVYAQPFATWLFRLYIDLTWFDHAHLRNTGARVFSKIDAFWAQLLEQLVAEGHLEPLDAKTVAPALLGPIERWTILSRLGCGETDRPEHNLADIARFSAENLFAIWGRSRPGLRLAAPITIPTASRPAALAPSAAKTAAAARSKRILQAAALECNERGYNKASIDEIAARAGVAVATLYKLFKDKSSLYAAALQAEAAAIAAPDNRPPFDLAATLAAYGQAASAADRSWALNVAMASEISSTPGIVAFNRAERAQIEADWAALLRDNSAIDVSGDPDGLITTNFLLGGVERVGVFGRLLFGAAAVDPAHLAAVAQVSAQIVAQRSRREGASV